MDGIYASYMTGSSGNGFVMFVFMNGVITGSDAMGVQFDGTYEPTDTGFSSRVRVSVPPNGNTIQGVASGPTGFEYEVEFGLPRDFADQPFVEIKTPVGVVNARFEKLRALEK